MSIRGRHKNTCIWNCKALYVLLLTNLCATEPLKSLHNQQPTRRDAAEGEKIGGAEVYLIYAASS